MEAFESVYAYLQKKYIEEDGFSGTGNLVVSRMDFRTVGPFKGIQVPEDMDWGRRALAAGRDLPAPPAGVPGPFAQADPGAVKAVLATAGFTDVELAGLRQPMWFGSDADNAHAFVLGLLGWMLQGFDDAGRDRALGDLRASLTAHDTGHGVCYESAAWIVQATR